MYVVRDPLGPAMAKFAHDKKLKARILKYWPKTTVDGVEIFGNLYLWVKGVGVIQDEAHLKIYNLLGIKVSELEAQEYKGVDNTYLEVKMLLDEYHMTSQQIKSYIIENSPQIYPTHQNVFSSDPDTPADENFNPDPYQNNPKYTEEYINSITLDENGNLPSDVLPEPQWDDYGWITDYVVYQPRHTIFKDNYMDTINDAEIINLVKTNNIYCTDIANIAFANPIFFTALKDTNEVLYEKRYRIVKKELTKKVQATYAIGRYSTSTNSTTSTILKQATVEVQYRRVKSIEDSSVQSLIESIRLDIDNLDDNGSTATTRQKLMETYVKRQGGRIHQMKLMHEVKVGYGEQTLSNKDYTSLDPNDNSGDVINTGKGLKVAAMRNVRARAFGEVFSQALTFRHTETPADIWQKITVIVIDIITVIIIVIMVYTGVGIAYIPLVLSAAALIQAGLAAYWAGQGDYAAAGYAGRSAQYLGKSAEIASYIIFPISSLGLLALDYILKECKVDEEWRMIAKMAVIILETMYNGGGDAAKEGAKEGSKETNKTLLDLIDDFTDSIKAEGIDAIVPEGITNIGSGSTLSNLFSNFSVTDWVRLLSMSFKVYTIHNDPSKSIADKQAQVNAQEEQLAAMDGPEAIDSVWKSWGAPGENYMDTNFRMEMLPDKMTHGLNSELMNKYYNSGY